MPRIDPRARLLTYFIFPPLRTGRWAHRVVFSRNFYNFFRLTRFVLTSETRIQRVAVTRARRNDRECSRRCRIGFINVERSQRTGFPFRGFRRIFSRNRLGFRPQFSDAVHALRPCADAYVNTAAETPPSSVRRVSKTVFFSTRFSRRI